MLCLNMTSPVCPAGLLPMGEEPSTLAKAAATWGLTAATPVTHAPQHAFPPGHPTTINTEKLVTGLFRA